MKMTVLWAAALAAGGISCAAAAEGEDDRPPPGTLAVTVPSELTNDWTVRPGDRARANLHAKAEPAFALQATETLSFLAELTLEQLDPPASGRGGAFENQALFVKTLTATYAAGGISAFAGKFTPHFGRAWDAAPGLYGDEFAKDYEFAERWGAGAGLALDGTVIGDVTVGASAFFVDRSALSESWITPRGRTREADGGPGNTGGPGSFAVALDGSPPGLAGLDYHLAYTRQARGEGDEAALSGVVGGVQWTVPLGAALVLAPFLEYARFENWEGARGADRAIWTAALHFDHGPWGWTAAYARRDVSAPGAGDERDHSLQISADYEFSNGMLAELGWWRVEEEGESADIIGLRLSYEFGTEIRLYR